ncbi:MAG TPA: hypothetical protein DCM02_13090 [Flavobacterium sp.]|nr:hypothetical protein [Flavobacterium sp.]
MGKLYNEYKNEKWDTKALESEITSLMLDEDVFQLKRNLLFCPNPKRIIFPKKYLLKLFLYI